MKTSSGAGNSSTQVTKTFLHKLLESVRGVVFTGNMANVCDEQRQTKHRTGQVPVGLTSWAFPAALAMLSY